MIYITKDVESHKLELDNLRSAYFKLARWKRGVGRESLGIDTRELFNRRLGYAYYGDIEEYISKPIDNLINKEIISFYQSELSRLQNKLNDSIESAQRLRKANDEFINRGVHC